MNSLSISTWVYSSPMPSCLVLAWALLSCAWSSISISERKSKKRSDYKLIMFNLTMYVDY